jgi:hypothetical protein
MNSFPSCFRRGRGGGKAANRRSPLALFPGEPTARLYDRLVEVLRNRHWRFLVVSAGKGFMQVSLDNSWPDAAIQARFKGGQYDRDS